jgi:amidohydrolase
MPSNWPELLDRAIDDLYPSMVAVRRHLHEHPEPSGQEYQTSQFLRRELAETSLPAAIGPDGRGLIVDSPGAHGTRVALRADIDALRIHDAKQVEYKSQHPGLMHACGHDAHAAVVFGAILGLRSAERAGALPWPVAWRGIFQPAEENSQGAHEMIAAGALEGVGTILGVHVDPSRPLGRIGVRPGPLTAACDELAVRIEGRGGHAARPHESIDPIATAAQLVSSIYLFVPRGVDSHDPVVVTIGQISGGDNFNVIPNEVLMRGTIRTLGERVRQQAKDHICKLARGLAEASGARIHIEFVPGPPSVDNDLPLTALVRRVAGDLLGPGHVDEIPRPSMGGDDFAYYLQRVPGCMFRLGCVSPTAGGAPLHSPLFDIDETALTIGAKILARATVLWSQPRE